MTREEKCLLAISKGIIYNPVNGYITGARGKVLRSKDKQGYVCFGLWNEGKTLHLYGHQFAWYYMYKECIPMIDHINKIKTDNRKVNLRKATRQLNSLNRNSKGYTFDKVTGKYLSQIMLNGKNIHLGRFNTKEEAINVYNNKKQQIFKQL